jgi:serine/threonine protein kinase
MNIKLSDFGNSCYVPESSPTIQDFQDENKEISVFARNTTIDDSIRDTATLPSHALQSNTDTPTTLANTDNNRNTSINLYVDTSLGIAPSEYGLLTPVPPSSVSSTSTTYLKDGLGRGTQAYTAPEIFIDEEYSFPIDIYSVGVTLYTLLTGIEPFCNIRNSVHLLMAIKRGFFESGAQADPEGPIYGVCKFQSGEVVDDAIVDLIIQMVCFDPSRRPTAKQARIVLEGLEVE